MMSYCRYLDYVVAGTVRSIVICVSVCLAVCLHARISQKSHVQTTGNFLYTWYLWSWLGPRLTIVQYVMYFRFCGWRHVCTQLGQWSRLKHDVVFRRVRHVAAQGAKLLSTMAGLLLTVLRWSAVIRHAGRCNNYHVSRRWRQLMRKSTATRSQMTTMTTLADIKSGLVF